MLASLGALVAQADDGATLNSDLASLRHESAPARSDIVGRLREVRALERANARSRESTSQSHAAESAAVRTEIASLRQLVSDANTAHKTDNPSLRHGIADENASLRADIISLRL